MNSQLDPSILAAITEEARQCFLDEDAPEYLQMLQQGTKQRDSDFTLLLRAAHSIKGGAGLASLDSLQKLAHKLEDVLIGIQTGQIQEVDVAWNLVEQGVDEVALILSQARINEKTTANSELIEALEILAISAVEYQAKIVEDNRKNETEADALIRTTLMEDLEASLATIEELSQDTPSELVTQLLTSFTDECKFLSETLNLPWLAETVNPIPRALEAFSTPELLDFTQEIITNLRSQRDVYLSSSKQQQSGNSAHRKNQDDFVANTLNQDLEANLGAISELTLDTPPELIKQFITDFADECMFLGETLSLPWLIETIAPIETILEESPPQDILSFTQKLIIQIREQRELYLKGELPQPKTQTIAPENQPATSLPQSKSPSFSQKTVLSQLKIPLQKLEGMSNNIEELILTQARFNRQQQLLNEANRRLRRITRQFEPIRDQIQDLYGQLAINSANTSQSKHQVSFNSHLSFNETLINTDSDTNFDALELDKYTELHTSLQSFQELMLKIQETRSDLELVDRELAEDLEKSQKNLDSLYTNITESRLVSFRLLANRFIPQIRNLNQRFDKKVTLEIIGENTPIDQAILEQLQTPLTHLLNNAFDHGIESRKERLANQKSEAATIILQATVENNQLVIVIQDDGAGIDTTKVFQRGLERGICPQDKSIDDFDFETIVDWIFHSGFSTAAKVSDISGRGMGLDIVRSQIRQLRGNIQVQTKLKKGTTFTIRLPLNLSLMSLLLIQLQNRIVAIPNTSIIETISCKELEFVGKKQKFVRWQKQTLPVIPLSTLLPCPRQPLTIEQAKVAIVLETSFGLIMIFVDSLIREEKLIVKPFDSTVPVPTYIGGCTVLGTGEVVPVILPLGFEESLINKDYSSNLPTKSKTASEIQTVLVAEDSVATRRMLEKILTAVGYKAVVCRDGQEALDRIKQLIGKIDLIISDIEMPKINGFELLQQVRNNDIFQGVKDIPIIIATSRTGERHRKEAIKLGATEYIGKPIQPQELINKVEALLIKS